MKRCIGVMLVLTTVACASQKEQRAAARILALHTKTVQSELETFAAHRALANQARQRSINVLDATRLHRENLNDEQLRVWQVSDAPRVALFKGVVGATEAAAARAAEAEAQMRANEASLAAMKSQVATRRDQLLKTTKLLAALGERDRLKAQLEFYRAFWSDVRSSVEDAAQASAQAADAATKDAGGVQ